MTYYAIEAGKEGDKPRTLHAIAPPVSNDRTKCGLRTENSVSLITEKDAFCPGCFPSE